MINTISASFLFVGSMFFIGLLVASIARVVRLFFQ